jgi:hypothetical protein
MFRRLGLISLLAAFAFGGSFVAAPSQASAAGNCAPVVVNYSAFDAAATTDTVTLYTTKGFEVIDLLIMRRDTDFSGGSISSYTVAVGKSGATT